MTNFTKQDKCKQTIMKLDGEEYTLFHGARLTLATPKIVRETLERLLR